MGSVRRTGHRVPATLWGLAALCSMLALGAPRVASGATVSPVPASEYTARPACSAPAPGAVSCLALQRQPTTATARARVHPLGVASNTHAGVAVEAECRHDYRASCLTPSELNNAYFPGEQPDSPAPQTKPQTIALVDAYNDPEAEHDLRIYDKELKLPECTHTEGCFTQVNEDGSELASSLPFPKTKAELEAFAKGTTQQREEAEEAEGWALEMATDIEIAHAVCQNCHILLVEASSPGYRQLETAEDSAATLHATEISNSWGGQEEGPDSQAFNHPGIAITAAAGDDGYLNWDQYATRNQKGSPYFEGADYPAASPHVVAVGGTSLTVGTGGTWKGETVWNEGSGAGGGGCGGLPAQPWQQADSERAGCAPSKRAVADVAADADPATGVAVYDSVPYPKEAEPLDWVPIGGTSVASPIIASMFALAGGGHEVEYPAQTLYSHLGLSSLHDVTTGGNGKCDAEYLSCIGSMSPLSPLDCGQGAWICNATTGYDGPTGVGTPNGIGAFKVGEAPAGEEGGQKGKPAEEPAKTEGGGSESSGGGGTGGGGAAEQPTGGSSSGSASGESSGTPSGPAGTSRSSSGSAANQPPRISALALTANARTALRHGSLGVAQVAFSFGLSSAATVRVPRPRFRPDTRLDPGGQHVESHGGRYGRGSAGGHPAR